MRAADERSRASPLSRLRPGQMRVGALILVMVVFAVAVRRGLVWPECCVLMLWGVDVCERCRPAGRYQRHDEQHMCNALQHLVYRDEGLGRCQPLCRRRGPNRFASVLSHVNLSTRPGGVCPTPEITSVQPSF